MRTRIFFFISRTIKILFIVLCILGCDNSSISPEADINELKVTAVTIGWTGVGSTIGIAGPNYINANRWMAPSNMIATKMHLNILTSVSGKKIKCAIYADGSGRPGILLGTTNELTNPGTGWRDFALASGITLKANTYYWLAMITDGAFQIKAETSGGNAWNATRSYSSGWPSTASGGSTSVHKHSLYASGTTAGSDDGNIRIPGGAVTHGDQLTINQVGPWTLQGVAKGSEVLSLLDPNGERISNWPGWQRPSWIPGTAYVYNENPSNFGGIVPSGGMTIDGYFVPGGTWVVQFRNFTDGIVIEGDCSGVAPAFPGVLFRGCRMRGNWASPGFFNQNGKSHGGIIWIMYSDAGGIGYTPPNICESIFESQYYIADRDHFYCIRNYVSIATTLCFGRCNGDAFVENYGREVCRYYNDDTYHMNGIGNSGGQTATLWLRNNIDLSPQAGAPANPYYAPQNDVLQMAADFGSYPGTGTNLDGSQGYQIKNNYLSGAQYTLQLGVDIGRGSTMSNCFVSGNKFSTKWFENGGSAGISYKNPSNWSTNGNIWTNNTWADDYGTGSWIYPSGNSGRQYPLGNGPRTGQVITAPN